MIVHTRIDNRLLHGIVATQWAPKSGCTRVMIIDDATANDSILKESMKLGRPAGNAISIITVDSAIANFKANKYEGQKVFIVVKEVDTLESIGLAVPQVTYLMRALRAKGFNVSDEVYTISKGKEELLRILKETNK